MAMPPTVVDAVAQGLKTTGRFPDTTTFLTRMADERGVDASATTPIVVANEVTTTRVDNHSENLVDYVYDETGAQIGRVWEFVFRMRLEVDIFTAAGDSRHSMSDLASQLEHALFRYDAAARGDLLPDPTAPLDSGETLGDVTEVMVGDGEPADDLTMSPSIRRRRQTIHIRFIDRLNEVDEYGPQEYVQDVVTAGPGDYEPLADADGSDLEYHPPP